MIVGHLFWVEPIPLNESTLKTKGPVDYVRRWYLGPEPKKGDNGAPPDSYMGRFFTEYQEAIKEAEKLVKDRVKNMTNVEAVQCLLASMEEELKVSLRLDRDKNLSEYGKGAQGAVEKMISQAKSLIERLQS